MREPATAEVLHHSVSYSYRCRTDTWNLHYSFTSLSSFGTCTTKIHWCGHLLFVFAEFVNLIIRKLCVCLLNSLRCLADRNHCPRANLLNVSVCRVCDRPFPLLPIPTSPHWCSLRPSALVHSKHMASPIFHLTLRTIVTMSFLLILFPNSAYVTPHNMKYSTIHLAIKGKVHRCTGTEALYRPYGP